MSGARELVDDQARSRFEGEDRHHAVLAAKAAFDVQRLPRAPLLPFWIAGGVFARAAERGAFDLARPRTADVAQRELDRAPDSRVGAIPGAQRADLHVHREPLADRT